MGKTERLTKGTVALRKTGERQVGDTCGIGSVLSNCYQRIDGTGRFTTGSTEYV